MYVTCKIIQDLKVWLFDLGYETRHAVFQFYPYVLPKCIKACLFVQARLEKSIKYLPSLFQYSLCKRNSLLNYRENMLRVVIFSTELYSDLDEILPTFVFSWQNRKMTTKCIDSHMAAFQTTASSLSVGTMLRRIVRTTYLVNLYLLQKSKYQK